MTSNLEALKLSRSASPLSLYLTIYTKASHECYINYMEGAKVLADWLGKIELPVERYPEILNTNFSVPRLLYGYEQQELAKILTQGRTYGKTYKHMVNAIYFVMSKEVIHNVY